MRRFESKNYTQSGGIGINITRNQETALRLPTINHGSPRAIPSPPFLSFRCNRN